MFTQKKITVPANGETLIFSLEGNAVVISQCGVFSDGEEPKFYFDDVTSSPQPIFETSVYKFPEGFERIVIEGTSESAGTSVTFLATGECLQSEINKPAPQIQENRRILRLGNGLAITGSADEPSIDIQEALLPNSAWRLEQFTVQFAMDGTTLTDGQVSVSIFNVGEDENGDEFAISQAFARLPYEAGAFYNVTFDRNAGAFPSQNPANDNFLNWQKSYNVDGEYSQFQTYSQLLKLPDMFILNPVFPNPPQALLPYSQGIRIEIFATDGTDTADIQIQSGGGFGNDPSRLGVVLKESNQIFNLGV